MIVDGLGNTIHAIVVRTVVHDNASKIPVRLILDGLDCVGDEARIIPIDDNDVYGRLFYEILHNNPAYLFDASGSLGAARRRHSAASSLKCASHRHEIPRLAKSSLQAKIPRSFRKGTLDCHRSRDQTRLAGGPVRKKTTNQRLTTAE